MPRVGREYGLQIDVIGRQVTFETPSLYINLHRYPSSEKLKRVKID